MSPLFSDLTLWVSRGRVGSQGQAPTGSSLVPPASSWLLCSSWDPEGQILQYHLPWHQNLLTAYPIVLTPPFPGLCGGPF